MRKVISFTQLNRSCDLARTCLVELHKIPPPICTSGKLVVEMEPQQFSKVLFLGYQWSFWNKSGEKSNLT